MKYYYHDAGLGDLIYSLPAIQIIGKGRVISGLRKDWIDALKPLYDIQPCIDELKHSTEEGLPAGFTDLALMRMHPYIDNRHLINVHLEWFHLLVWKHDKPFLFLPERAKFNNIDYAVVNVTPRYKDLFFNFCSEMSWLSKRVGKIYFLGLAADYSRFMRENHIRQNVEFLPTKDLLEAAYIIKDAKYFTSNESALLAIRQGLHLSYRVQKHPFVKHVITKTGNETILNENTYRIHRTISLIKKYTVGYKEKIF